jgi:23S rRNA (cytidine1920-2'-O)/16S rRNA (cytidine1409-2'-O)-methyltransferase
VTRRRLDLELVRRGLVATPGEAVDVLRAGRVTVSGRPVLKPSSLVAADEPITVTGAARPYASRGGLKLAGALDRFGVDPRARRCLDAGASTGGFTDVLLSRGAEHVVAVDVGYGQLAWRLREDPRVTVLERTNARSLTPSDLPFPPDLVVADLSFISLTAAIPALAAVAAPGADFILLVKPQFEATRADVGPGGVVSDPDVWRRAVTRVAEACRDRELTPLVVVASMPRGPAGNVEFLLHARHGAPAGDLDVEAAMEEGRELAS